MCNKLIIFVLFLLFLSSINGAAENPNGLTLDSVKIYGVSTMISELNYEPKGSLVGGTYIYIRVSGHDLTPSNNKITVGPYDCNIPEKGVNENTITCETTEGWDPTRRWKQEVVVKVNGKPQSTCEGSCHFTYQDNNTPFLDYITPSATTPNNNVKWFGIWRVKNTADISQIYLENEQGKYNCNRFQLNNTDGPINLNPDETMAANDQVAVPCQIANDQPAGLYTIYAKTTWGNPLQRSTVLQLTADGSQEYAFVVTAEITSISQRDGGESGNRITIEGNGFGNKKQNASINVGGLNCSVVSINNNEIVCDIEAGIVASNNIKGQGFQYTLYDLVDTGVGNATQLKENYGTIAAEKIVKTGNQGSAEFDFDEPNKGIYMRGFFKAPRTGIYNFWVAADDSAIVLLNETNLSTDSSSSTEVITQCNYTSRRNYYQQSGCENKSADVNLTEGEYYWLEIFAVNGGGPGHLTLSVETPAINDAVSKNSLNKIQDVHIIPDYDYSTWTLKVQGQKDKPFGIKFVYKDASARKTYTDKTEEKTWVDWTASNFGGQVRKQSGWQGIECEMFDLDGSGNRCDGCEAEGREFVFTWTTLRPSEGRRSVSPQILGLIDASFVETQQQSGAISGTYSLNFNGQSLSVWSEGAWTTDIPFGYHGGHIISGLRELTQNYSYQYMNKDGNDINGRHYRIWFRDSDVKSGNGLELVSNNIVGGNSKATIEITDFQGNSNRALYEPIPFDMVVEKSDLSEVQVTINNILSVCQNLVEDNTSACKYATIADNTPIVSTFSVSGTTLTLNLSTTNAAVTFTTGNTTISYGNAECASLNIDDLSAATCTLQAVPEAGDIQPVVFVQGFGYASITQAAETVSVSVASVSPTSGSLFGGQLLTITGTGFPLGSIEGLTVNIGPNTAEVVSSATVDSSSSQIIVKIPADSEYSFTGSAYTNAKDVIVTYNSQSNSAGTTFTYSDSGLPVISGVSPTDASPVIKQTLTITGTGFGTDKTVVKVYLINADGDIAYEPNVNTCTDTQIEAMLGGGSVGLYTVRVQKGDTGFSVFSSADPVTFEYIIRVNSVSPVSGGTMGGTLLTISGENFSSSQTDNAVFLALSPSENLQCNVLSATTTEITCITPVQSEAKYTGNLDIVVQGRLIEESTCTGTCNFEYLESKNGVLDVPLPDDTYYGNGQSVTLTGTNFGSGGSAIINFGGVEVIASQATDTSITFDVPTTLKAGAYSVLVNPNNQGYAGAYEGHIYLSITDVSPDTISKGGAVITINGNGFDSESASVLVNTDSCRIQSITAQQIVCRAQNVETGGSKNIKVNQDGFDQEICSDCLTMNGVTTATAQTLVVSEGSNTFEAVSSFTVTLTLSSEYTSQTVTGYLEYVNNENIYTYDATVSGLVLTFSDVPAGTYTLFVNVDTLGFIQYTSGISNEFVIQLPTLSYGSQDTSFAGGSDFEITGNGFDSTNFEANSVHVCGYPCPILETTTFSALHCELPKVMTVFLRSDKSVNTVAKKQPFKASVTPYTIFGDNTDQEIVNSVQDDYLNTYYRSSGGLSCHFGFDFGDQIKMELSAFKFKPYLNVNDLESFRSLAGAIIEGSDDGTNYTELIAVPGEVHQGYNTLRPSSTTAYRYIRFSNTVTEGTANCEIAEANFWGHEYFKTEVSTSADFQCDVKVNINGQETTENTAVTYSASNTPYVTDISPMYGWIQGGDEITITGTGFGSTNSDISIFIDGIECATPVVTGGTSITCTTGDKTTDAAQSIVIKIAGYKAVVPDNVVFYYGLIWSNDLSWGGEAPPREGDSVYVPAGKALIIDQSIDFILYTVVCEGTMIFADNVDMNFNANNILIRRGQLIIGTESAPYQNKLVITLHGKYEDKQLPEIGNKVLACLQCNMNIHGSAKTPTWTTINATIDVGATQLTVSESVNWVVGDELVIATTSYDGKESEKVTITAISGNDITFQPELKYKHISVTETYGSASLDMKAEVGNLTRNVVIQGNPVDSMVESYGGHVMVHGKSEAGSVARISQVEFRYTGQPRILGRYNLHFHMNGDASDSLVDGIVAHDTNARLIAIHAVQYLTVQNSVAYNCKGHNIFLEDGIETHNTIKNNLIVSPISANNMLQTDLTVACIWVTNPLNYVTGNHVVGSQFYGMWYEIKEHPDGPSATADICPRGMRFGDLTDNVGHSNTRFALRFFYLSPRTYPCMDLANKQSENPYDDNPSLETTISGFVGWKNGESAVLAEHVGNMIFTNMVLADNVRAAFEAHEAAHTKEDVVFQDSFVIGQTAANGEDAAFMLQYKPCGVAYPRSNGLVVKNVEFHEFPANTAIFESASQNQFAMLETVGAKQHTTEGLTLDAATTADATKIKWVGPKTNIFYDKDGTLTGGSGYAYITPYYPHHDQAIADGVCTYESDPAANEYDGSIVCEGTEVRGIILQSGQPESIFQTGTLKIFNVNDSGKTIGLGDLDVTEADEDFTLSKAGSMVSPDCFGCYAANLPTGYMYNMHWDTGKDFDQMTIRVSREFQESDKNIILRFNYTETRELFDIFPKFGWTNMDLIQQQSDFSKFVDTTTVENVPTQVPATPSADTCGLGDYMINQEDKLLYVCLNAKNRLSKYQNLEINGVYCRDTCPTPGFECEKEVARIRQFSNPDNYNESIEDSKPVIKNGPGDDDYIYGVPEVDGRDVIIPCEWTMVLDKARTEFDTLIIDGTLKIDNSIPHTEIFANNIWIRGGKIVAGSENTPFTSKLTITLTGNKSSPNLIIDDFSETGTKSIGVTGLLELYGKQLIQPNQRLTANLAENDTIISVDGDITDWQVGDEIVLGASKTDGSGFEKLEIASISGQDITVTSQVQNFHYGSSLTTFSNNDQSEIRIDNKYGSGMDMRTIVSNISRNIKIIGSDEDGWGGHLQVYHWIVEETETNSEISARGRVILQGVELENMGQKNSLNGGLHFFYTNTEGDDSKVIGSSIHDCNGPCMNVESSWNVQFDGNTFYKGLGKMMAIKEISGWSIQDNVFIGASADVELNEPLPVAMIYMETFYNPETDAVIIKNNHGQGSAGLGFGLPAVSCEQKDQTTVKFNYVGKCAQAGFIFNMKNEKCYYAGHLGVYGSKDGISINTDSSSYIMNEVIVVESQYNIKLRSGSGNERIYNNYLQNAYINAFALGDSCPECYASADQINCQKTVGMQLHVTVQHGNPLTTELFGGLDAICNQPPPFGSMHLQNLEIVNFKESYDGTAGAQVCGKNRVFKNHPVATDATAGHYLTNVVCTDCEHDAFAFIADPNPDHRGWFGGCGEFDCTGLENVLIQDLTGDFLGYIGAIISYNEDIGDSLDYCQFVPAWNAYDCESQDNFGIMEWEAIGADKLLMVSAPVFLQNDKFTNRVNQYREWSWNGPEPLNERPNVFVGILEINQRHTVSYNTTKPYDLIHKLQQRIPEGEPDRFVIWEYEYGEPLTIEVLVNDEIVENFPFHDPQDLGDHITDCGANNYYYQNNTVHFVVTNVPECQVQVRLLNSVQVNMRLKVSVDDFYNNDTQTSFMSRIQAFLNIPMNKLKIVGLQAARRLLETRNLQEVETTVQFVIKGGVPGTEASGYSDSDAFLELQGLAKQLQTAVDNGELDVGSEIIGMEYTIVVKKDLKTDDGKLFTEADLIENQNNGNGNKDNKNEEKISRGALAAIIIGCIVGVIGLLVIVKLGYNIYQKKQKIAQCAPEQHQDDHMSDIGENVKLQNVNEKHMHVPIGQDTPNVSHRENNSDN